MSGFMVRLLALALLLAPGALLSPSDSRHAPTQDECLYPSLNERFGVTVYADHAIGWYNVAPLSTGSYLNWRVDVDPSHPGQMHYFPLISTGPRTHWPRDEGLEEAVRGNLGFTWIIGNESDNIWQNNTPPGAYARQYHDAYTTIKAVDPTARFAIAGMTMVTPLRLQWLEQAWNAYRDLYGVDMPVDVWNTHAFVLNEMTNLWGADLPPGIDNAVGYGEGTWTEASLAGASGGTVHESRNPGAGAYFAFRGAEATLHLRTGPDSGIAEIYLDNRWEPLESVDLYSPTPGAISRAYTGLASPLDPRLQDKHHLRVQVTGQKNPAASDVWVRVDAIEADSTADLSGGRLEDDSPARANIVTVDDHDRLDLVVEQIRTFRQWMADHGQQNKPLINTEYGILLSEQLGYDALRTQNFMLGSFQEFAYNLVDEELGYPADGNRMLQRWFWFSLAVDQFEGYRNHSGLYSATAPHDILPLGAAYADFVTPLATPYTDLTSHGLHLSPQWPLFAGQPGLVQVEATLRNRGVLPSGPFTVQLAEGPDVLQTWSLPGLSGRYMGDDTRQLQTQWRPVITGDRTITLAIDDNDQVAEPCENNNIARATLQALPYTDLALSGLTTVPRLPPPVPPGSTTTVSLQAILSNLGSLGAQAGQIVVNFWHGDPDDGGVLIDSQILLPDDVATLPLTVTFDWPERSPGRYDVVVEVEPVAGDIDLSNNWQALSLLVASQHLFLPTAPHGQRIMNAQTAEHLLPAPDAGRMRFRMP